VQKNPESKIEFFPDIHQDPKNLWQSLLGGESE